MKAKIFFKSVVIVLVLAGVSVTERVYALCATPPEQGTWENMDSNTRSITKVVVRFQCQDQVLNGQPYPPGVPFYLHLYGKCHPSDCDWGEKEAQELASGWLYSYYNQGFAKRHVYARMSQRYPGKLFVWVYTDFTDPQRKDYSVGNWFNKI